MTMALKHNLTYVATALIGIWLHFSVRSNRSPKLKLRNQAPAPPVSRNGFVRRTHKRQIQLNDYPRREGIHDYTDVTADRPRVFHYEPVTIHHDRYQATFRKVDPLTDQIHAKTAYHYLRPYEKPYHEQCKFIRKWQSRFYPTCNQMHELNAMQEDISLLSMEGSWRSTWKFTDGEDKLVLKMLQFDREFDHESYSYHQIDAMALERLTFSDFVVTSYGFCGQSAMVEWAPHDARTLVKDSSIHSTERLRIARDLSRGLNHIHSIDMGKGRRASLVHNDLNMANIVNVNKQTLKFNDFNLAVLLKRNKTEPCGYPVRFRGDLWRSPEEVRNVTYVNEKIDVYSLGNILFQVLTRHQPWTWLEPEGKLEIPQVAQRKLDGKAPNFPVKIVESPKLAHQALYYGTLACYEADPFKRPTAHQLSHGFNQALRWVEQKAKPSIDEIRNLFIVQTEKRATPRSTQNIK